MLHALAFRLLLLLALLGGSVPDYVPRNGDLVFQTSRSAQSTAVQAATRSPYSHMGVVFLRNGAAHVFEAVDPVQSTPLHDWIARGEGGRFVAKRLRDANDVFTPQNLQKLREVATTLDRKPYDPYFEWSDDRIYCSELVWKIYQRALGIEIGSRQRLRDFDWSAPIVRDLAQKRWSGHPPLNEPAISPASMFASDLLVTVYSR